MRQKQGHITGNGQEMYKQHRQDKKQQQMDYDTMNRSVMTATKPGVYMSLWESALRVFIYCGGEFESRCMISNQESVNMTIAAS